MSQHHKRNGWPKVAKRARERVAATLPAPCINPRCRMGGIVLPGQRWHVGHRRALSQGGDVNDYGPEHAKCNESSGGKLGAAVSNARRGAVTRGRPSRLAKW